MTLAVLCFVCLVVLLVVVGGVCMRMRVSARSKKTRKETSASAVDVEIYTPPASYGYVPVSMAVQWPSA